jgi:excisionase family DNA binding protein
MDKEILLTVDEVALKCRVSVYTVRRWVAPANKGGLKAVKAGRRYLIEPTALDAYLRRSQPAKS